jgi:hypothetical protein
MKTPLEARTTVEWVRFEHEREPYGVFSYLSDAKPKLSPEARAEVHDLCIWFGNQLDAPDVAAIERVWFKAEASEYVERARRLTELVCAAGFPIVERRSRRVPGKIRSQDAHQVAVITFRDAPRPRKR